MKKIINYIKSLGWSREDAKKILLFIIMLLIGCFIVNKFLLVKVRAEVEIMQGKYNSIPITGSIDAQVNIPYGIDTH